MLNMISNGVSFHRLHLNLYKPEKGMKAVLSLQLMTLYHINSNNNNVCIRRPLCNGWIIVNTCSLTMLNKLDKWEQSEYVITMWVT